MSSDKYEAELTQAAKRLTDHTYIGEMKAVGLLEVTAALDRLIEERDGLRDGNAANDLVIADLSMLVRRLCRRIDKLSTADPIVAQATDYLFRKGLQGSPALEENCHALMTLCEERKAEIEKLRAERDAAVAELDAKREKLERDVEAIVAEVTANKNPTEFAWLLEITSDRTRWLRLHRQHAITLPEYWTDDAREAQRFESCDAAIAFRNRVEGIPYMHWASAIEHGFVSVSGLVDPPIPDGYYFKDDLDGGRLMKKDVASSGVEAARLLANGVLDTELAAESIAENLYLSNKFATMEEAREAVRGACGIVLAKTSPGGETWCDKCDGCGCGGPVRRDCSDSRNERSCRSRTERRRTH